MHVIYSGASAPDITLTDIEAIEAGMRALSLDMTNELAAELGLDGVQRLVRRTRVDYPLISRIDWQMWKTFMPMAYAKGPWSHVHNDEQRIFLPDTEREIALEMSQFDFNIPPLPVLEAWRDARRRKQFKGYIIRTPESRSVMDPILVGVSKDSEFHLMARWAEGALLTIEEIRTQVTEIWELKAQHRSNGVPCICGCGKKVVPEMVRVKIAACYPKEHSRFARPYGPTRQYGMLRSECYERLFGVEIPDLPYA